MGTLLCVANSQRPASGDGGNYWIYVAQVVLTNACLGFGGTLPNFLQGTKWQFWATFSKRVSMGVLLFHNGKDYGKSKT